MSEEQVTGPAAARAVDVPGAAPRRSTDLPEDAPWWAKWLVANCNEAWRWGSVWWPAACAAAIEVWAQLTPEQQQSALDWLLGLVPASFRPHALAGVFMATIFLRVINLTRKKEEAPKQ